MSATNYVTQETFERMQAELHILKSVDRPAASAAIAEAREKGDLKENAEYDAAKEAQGILEAKIQYMEGTLANVRIIDAKDIDISCDRVDGMAQVSVKDEGIGISEEHLGKLFDRFYRVESDESITGFGIGLYLSAEIIHCHNGKTWVESELGKGSTFFFSLPLA